MFFVRISNFESLYLCCDHIFPQVGSPTRVRKPVAQGTVGLGSIVRGAEGPSPESASRAQSLLGRTSRASADLIIRKLSQKSLRS